MPPIRSILDVLGTDRRDGHVVILSEAPLEQAAPGHSRRVETLVRTFTSAGARVSTVAVNEEVPSGLARRCVAAVRYDYKTGVLDALRPDAVIVVGLGAPHMLQLARRLARRVTTVFDACDSWRLQLKARAEVGASQLPIWVGAQLVRLPSELAGVSYISSRDADIDRGLVSKPIVVAVPIPDPQLASLEDVSYPLTRIVIPGDFTSFHTQALTLDALTAAAEAAADLRDAKVELFGRVPEDFVAPAGVTLMPWADSLTEIYAGDTCVISTNLGGSGVPNKVVEAVAARRPVLLHKSLQYLEADYPGRLVFFETAKELRSAIVRTARSGDHS